MSLQKVKSYLEKYNLQNEILIFDGSSATVHDAAERLNCKESDIAKTLAFYVAGKPILILMAGDAKCQNSLFKSVFHEKAKMIPFEEVESVVGHAPGGVCPFGINENIQVYFDESLKAHDYIYPACGSSNSAIKLSIQKLEEIVPNHTWINVSTKPENVEE